jgi:hypothetical protein
MLVFSTPLVNNRPSDLLTGSSPPPSPLSVRISMEAHVLIQRVTGGGEIEGLRQKTPAAKSLYYSKSLGKANI